MKSRRGKLGMFTVAMALSCAFAGSCPADKPKKYARDVMIGSATFRFGNTCIRMTAQMGSGGFFDRLEKMENHGVVSFQKNLRRVDSYPEYVRLRVFGLSGSCSSGRLSLPADRAAELMRTARFRASCGTAPSERTLDVSGRGTKSPFVDSRAWTYYLNIHSEGCLLSAPLTVRMVSTTGSPMAEFKEQL